MGIVALLGKFECDTKHAERTALSKLGVIFKDGTPRPTFDLVLQPANGSLAQSQAWEVASFPLVGQAVQGMPWNLSPRFRNFVKPGSTRAHDAYFSFANCSYRWAIFAAFSSPLWKMTR